MLGQNIIYRDMHQFGTELVIHDLRALFTNILCKNYAFS